MTKIYAIACLIVLLLMSSLHAAEPAVLHNNKAISLSNMPDMLVSFMRRFRSNVYNEVRFPGQGKFQAKVSVDREGNLLQLSTVELSTNATLDAVVLSAIRRAAPFGPLPRQWRHDNLDFIVTMDCKEDRCSLY